MAAAHNGVPNSEQRAREYYSRSGPEGLSAFFSAEHTQDCVRLVLALPARGKCILDVGCGTGRITVPLAKHGLEVTGLDLSPDMIKAAKQYAKANNCDIRHVVGSMTQLPFEPRSFDRVYCIAAFYHLLRREEQVRALREMLHVLDDNGVALILTNDGSVARRRMYIEQHGYGPDGRVAEVPSADGPNTAYVHDKQTLRDLAESCRCNDAAVKFVNIGQRRMIALQIWR